LHQIHEEFISAAPQQNLVRKHFHIPLTFKHNVAKIGNESLHPAIIPEFLVVDCPEEIFREGRIGTCQV
jgi:hypothetical protein